MKKKLSIRDIGKELGISITTVSFILNGKAKEKRISESLTKKVLDYVEQVGFKPNSMAQGLRTGKSRIIALMVEDISNAFFAQVARLIEEEAHNKGYRILYCSTENSVEKTRELIRMFRDRLIDGYIITPPEGVEGEIEALAKDNLPVVLVDRDIPSLKLSSVVIDNVGSSYAATSHLIEQGFKNIAFVTLNSRQAQMTDRLNGYRKAVSDGGLEPHVKELNFHAPPEQNSEQIAAYLKQHPEVDAVFFSTNYIGIWGLQAIKKLSLKVPEDIGILSFDDLDLFDLYSPPITAVAQPIERISKQVIQLMLKALDEPSHQAQVQQVVLPARLVVRSSSIRKK